MTKPKSIIIGLTGTIASGKSTVSKIFREKRIPVICADRVAREVVRAGTPALKKIAKAFGKEVLRKNSTLNRKRLAALIFSNLTHRNRLNQIVHPAVISVFKKRIQEFKKAEKPLIVLDIPLLFEAKMEFLCDVILVAYTPELLLTQRLQKRDRLTLEDAKARVSSQHSIELKKKKAHHVIDNSGKLATTRRQTLEFIQNLKSKRG